jgi:hypothetical protein
MVKAPRYLLDLLILAVLAGLAVTVLVTWPLREPSAASANDAGFTPALADQASAASRRPSSRSVAGLFGYRAPAPAAPLTVKPTAPVDQTAGWIKYMGYVTEESGRAKYFFKDTRSGQVLNLYLGQDNGKGWKLASITGTLYTIENNGTIYKVPK